MVIDLSSAILTTFDPLDGNTLWDCRLGYGALTFHLKSGTLYALSYFCSNALPIASESKAMKIFLYFGLL